MYRPSALIDGALEAPLPVWVGDELAWLTRVFAPVARSNRKMSPPPLVSTCPVTRVPV